MKFFSSVQAGTWAFDPMPGVLDLVSCIGPWFTSVKYTNITVATNFNLTCIAYRSDEWMCVEIN